MKRGQIKRRPYRIIHEPGRQEWKEPVAGFCECGCGRHSNHLQRHHVVLEQVVRRAGGDPWDQRNSMLLHEVCHRRQHDAFERIPRGRIPESAFEFAGEILGLAAERYFDRHYPA